MTTSVRYTGSTTPFFEVALTGRQRLWTPGQQQDLSNADAATLIATGNFAPASPARARSAAQLAAAPSAADIALDGEFFLYTDATQRYVINPAGTAYVLETGGGGSSTVAGTTDFLTASLPTDAALAAAAQAEADALTVSKMAVASPMVASTRVVTTATAGTFVLTSSTAPPSGFNFVTCPAGGTLSASVDGSPTVIQAGDNFMWNGATWTFVPHAPIIGIFPNPGALPTASFTYAGCRALSGSGVPYALYSCDGSAWNLGGAVTSVNGLTGAVVVAPATTVGTGGTRSLTSADNGAVIPTPSNSTYTVNTGLGAGFGCGFTGAGVVSFVGTATVNDKRTTGAANPACSLLPVGTDVYDCIGSKA